MLVQSGTVAKPMGPAGYAYSKIHNNRSKMSLMAATIFLVRTLFSEIEDVKLGPRISAALQ